MAKSNVFDALSIQQGMLEVTGVWPMRSPTCWYYTRKTMTWVVDIIFYATLIMEFTKNVIDEDYQHLTELISFMSSPTSWIIKHICFIYGSRQFLDTLDQLKNPVLTNYPQSSDKHIKGTIKIARIISRVYQFLVFNLVLLYLLKPFLTKDNLAIRFSLIDLGKWRLPFHLFQVYSIAVECWNNSTLDVLCLGLISIGCAQFDILRDKILNVRQWAGFTYDEINEGRFNKSTDYINDKIDYEVNERLKECVEHHLTIIDYVARLEDIYTYYFLTLFLNSVIVISNTWFQFLLATDLLNVIFLVVYTVVLVIQLGMYCVCGNNLLIKSSEIRDACYLSEWYKCGPKVRKTLMILMERAKRPTILTAGQFSVLSLGSFGTLMKTSYSYFALMNKLNSEK